MLKDNLLNVELREEKDLGKNQSRRLRSKGLVPAVLYMKGKKSIPVMVSPKKLIEILTSDTGENTIFSLQIAGKSSKETVMIKDFQKDPVTERIIHADFIKIDLQKAIQVKVPVHPVGTAAGVKQQSGILDIIIREIDISCLPADIPESVEIDVSELLIGQHLSIKDLKVSDKIKILDDPEQTVVVVSAPRIEEAPVAEAAPEAAAEPEVIKKGKEEKEGEEQKEEQPERAEAKEKEKKEKKEK